MIVIVAAIGNAVEIEGTINSAIQTAIRASIQIGCLMAMFNVQRDCRKSENE